MSRRCILILDDDTDMAEAFGLLLGDYGIDVRVAGDPETGWAELARLPPDAILLDLRLGARDGMEFLRQLRASPLAEIPVAMITGDYLVDDRVTEEICALSAQLHFKPLWDEDVVRIVKGLFAHTRRDLAPRAATQPSPPDHQLHGASRPPESVRSASAPGSLLGGLFRECDRDVAVAGGDERPRATSK